jgi:hypothetical protein
MSTIVLLALLGLLGIAGLFLQLRARRSAQRQEEDR